MEEKKINLLPDEALDEVTGGGGFVKPGDETIEQEVICWQQTCGCCKKVITPEWNKAARKYICPNCKTDL